MEGHHLMNPQTDLGDRFPQWSQNETREFIALRAELDRTFMETKRNRLLWDLISNRMKEKGFHRSPEQCKCKWKNLVTRYKGSETMEAEAMRQFPFQEELRAIFAARMQRLLWQQQESESSGAAAAAKRTGTIKSDDHIEDEEADRYSMEDMITCDADHHKSASTAGNYNNKSILTKKKRKLIVGRRGDASTSTSTAAGTSNSSDAYEMVEEFLRKQLEMEMRWCKEEEAREEERRAKEMEWRRTMEALERERILMDRRWREKEEQRRAREEARAERRDHLITALLNKLIHEDNIN